MLYLTRLPLFFPAVGPIGIKAERNRWSHAKKPHHFFCDRAILTPPLWEHLQKEHSTDGATVGEVLGDRCKSIFWSTSSTQPTDGATVRESKSQIIVMQAWPSKQAQSTDGATDGEVLHDQEDPIFGVPKKAAYRWSHRWKEQATERL